MDRTAAVTEEQLRDEAIAEHKKMADCIKRQAKEIEQLRKRVERDKLEFDRPYRSLFWYEESYSRMSDQAKREFREMSEQVGKEIEEKRI